MSIATKLQQILDAKASIKAAIEEKGVTVGNAPLTQYATKIGEIESGNSIINFTINGVSYQADSGMEWYDWVSSSYNIGGIVCDGYAVSSYVRDSTYGSAILYNNVSERPWNIIGEGRSYYYNTGGGGND